jgi:uncharacterized protein YndB with AHSA1/START domain
VLESAGLITRGRTAQLRPSRLQGAPLKEAADWIDGYRAFPIDSVEMDVRVGGKWKLTMFAGPKGMRIDWDGEYIEVDEPSRLVFTVSDEPSEDRYAMCTVDLTDLGDGRTEMHFEQQGGLMPAAFYRRAEEGWGGFFDRMDERLAGA